MSVQFMPDRTVAMFEFTVQDAEVRVVSERHRRLVAAGQLDRNAVRAYRPGPG